jgi:flagellar hook-associated protein 1 FlgK
MSLNIGKTALNNSQIALDLVGKNIAHANDPNYARQRLHITSTFDGNVVNRIEQAVSESLQRDLVREQGRLGFLEKQEEILTQIEDSINELSDSDLSSTLDAYYQALEKLSLDPHDSALRRTAVEASIQVTDIFHSMSTGLSNIAERVDREIGDHAEEINTLLTQIGELNIEVARREGATHDNPAADIRDRRHELVNELSGMMNVTTTELSNGSLLLQSDGRTLVFHGESRGVYIDRSDGTTRLRYNGDHSFVEPTGGTLGGLVQGRDDIVTAKQTDIDNLAAEFIWLNNSIHNSGRGTEGLTEIIADTKVSPNFIDDPLDEVIVDSLSIGNQFKPQNGSMEFEVRNEISGETLTSTVNVTLVGDDKTTLQDLADQIAQIDQLDASVDRLGRLQISSSNGYSFFIKEDTSNASSFLGLNNLFDGKDAASISVNEDIVNSPSSLAVAQSESPGDNSNLLELIASRDAILSDGRAFSQHYEDLVSDVASESGRITSLKENQSRILADVSERRNAFSGVNLDEEAANLLRFQQSYQAAAQYITVQNRLMDILFQAI